MTRQHLRFLLSAAILVLSSWRSDAAIPVASAPNLAFERPQVSGDGRVAVMERRWFTVSGCLSECPEEFDIIVADLGDKADCGQDALREVTRDGVSLDPSITLDGSRIAFRSVVDGVPHLRVMSSNGEPQIDHALLFGTTVSNLEIDPTGQYLFFHRTINGSRAIVRFSIAAATVHIVIYDTASRSVMLSDNYPVDRFGSAYFVTREAVPPSPQFPWLPPHVDSIVRWRPMGQFLTVYTESMGVALGNLSVDPDGTRLAFTRQFTDASGTMRGHLNLRMLPAGPTYPLTPPLQEPVTFSHVSIARDGQVVTFASDGNFTGQNSDRSEEVFGIWLQPPSFSTLQVTNFLSPISPPGPPLVQQVDGTATATGRNIWYSTARCINPPCRVTQGVVNPWRPDVRQHVDVTSYWPLLAPLESNGTDIVTPPFDFLVGLPAEACELVGSQVKCKATLRNADEAVRTLFVRTEFAPIGAPAVPVSDDVEPQTVTLTTFDTDPSSTAVSIVRFGPPAMLAGVFRVFATDTANVGADRMVFEVAFNFVP